MYAVHLDIIVRTLRVSPLLLYAEAIVAATKVAVANCQFSQSFCVLVCI
jgi:hypothetical protein